MSNKWLRTLILCSGLLLAITPVFAGWPNILLPPQAKQLPQLAEKIFTNGVPLKIVNFSSRLSVAQVLRYYRNRWSDGFVENKYEQWQQISRLQGKYFITVQVKPAGPGETDIATRGRLNILNLNKGDTLKTSSFPFLQGSVIVNDVQTVDKYKKARTLLILNKYPAYKNAEYYQTYFKKEKWNQVMNKTVNPEAFVLVFSKDEDETSLVIRSSGDDSSILVNEIKKKNWFN